MVWEPRGQMTFFGLLHVFLWKKWPGVSVDLPFAGVRGEN